MVTEVLQWTGFDYLFNFQKRFFWGYLLLSFFLALAYIRITRLPFSNLFSLKIWWHPSARLDYAWFVLSSMIKLTLVLPLIFSVREVALWVINFMEAGFGYQSKLVVPHTGLMLAYTLSLFVVGDFTRYWLHRLMHRLPWLWEFHKVHHSAEVLTPFTFYRVHPIENILFGFRYAISAGVVTGLFVYLFGAGLEIIDVLGVNLFVFIAHVVGDNLRHSHVSLRYPKWLEKMLISPAQHQFHHTLKGSQKNFGGVLSIWDSLFATLRLSRSEDQYEFGVHGKDQFNSLSKLLFLPFKNIYVSFVGFIQYVPNKGIRS